MLPCRRDSRAAAKGKEKRRLVWPQRRPQGGARGISSGFDQEHPGNGSSLMIGAGATTQQAAAVKERWGIIQMNKQSRAEIRAFDAIFRTMIKLILKQPAPADAIVLGSSGAVWMSLAGSDPSPRRPKSYTSYRCLAQASLPGLQSKKP